MKGSKKAPGIDMRTTATGCALLLLAATGAAQAADTASSDEAIETVVVTGIRHAIQGAIEEKKNSGSIVEAITAEDIGKLPDTSIAESISRLPGLTSQRANGRASAISLRGTDPAFTSALLNGREQVSTGDNRSVEFDQYPSELLSSVIVYKTPDAQLVGQGLAGTIDLRTTRPLDYGKRAIVFNIRGERNSNRDLGATSTDHGYRASFSYIDQFADNTFGIAFGYARLDQPLATEGVGAYEPWHPNGGDTRDGSGRRVRYGRHEDPDGHGQERARRRDGGPAVEAERFVLEHPRPLLHEVEGDRRRPQSRVESRQLSSGYRVFKPGGRRQHAGRRNRRQPAAARAQFPVHHR